MKYHNILFSRTQNVDYRWMIVPEYINSDELRELESIIWSDDVRNYFSQSQQSDLCPFFLIEMASSYILVRFRRTAYHDSRKRPIDCIEGISVSLDQAWFLRYASPWILSNHWDLLDVWSGIEFQKAEDLINNKSEDFELNFGIMNEELNCLGSIEERSEHSDSITYSEKGFNSVINRLSPYPYIPDTHLQIMQIAFGCSFFIENAERFDICAPISGESHIQITENPPKSLLSNAKLIKPIKDQTSFQNKVNKLKSKGNIEYLPTKSNHQSNKEKTKRPLIYKLRKSHKKEGDEII